MTKEQKLNEFWNSFGWLAFDENTVPDETPLPYITYAAVFDSFGAPVVLSASLWHRSRSWTTVTEKAAEIEQSVGYSGMVLPYDGGYLWLKRGHPFSQRMSDEDDGIRRIYINIEAEYLSEN